MERTASPFHAPSGGKRASSIIGQIFSAEHPDHFTRQIPAQRLYLAIKEQGLSSAVEVIEMASREQIQLMLDFDLWSYDHFEEQQVWDWLELPESTDDLGILQKVLHSIDPKLIAMLLEKHTNIIVNEEATDSAPGDEFYTPDKGHTWIQVQLEDPRENFLFKRLLAMIFETSTELFYQLIQIPSVATPSALEEESYQEKQKRLASEGFPEDAWAAELNSPLPVEQAIQRIQQKDKKEPIRDIYAVPSFLQSYSIPQPLKSLLENITSTEEAEQEVTLLCNGALMHFRVPTWEQEQVHSTIEQVRGVANIGLAMLLEKTEDFSTLDIYTSIGMTGLYRTGLSSLYTIRSSAVHVSDDSCENDPQLLTFIAGLRFPFPKLPNFLSDDGTFQLVCNPGESQSTGKLEPGFRAFETIEDVHLAELILKKLSK